MFSRNTTERIAIVEDRNRESRKQMKMKIDANDDFMIRTPLSRSITMILKYADVL